MSGSSKKSSWSDVIGEMFGGQGRDDEVTRTELVGRTGTMNSRMAAHHSPSNKRDCAAVGVCAKEIKPELNTLDETDFVRDVPMPEKLGFRFHLRSGLRKTQARGPWSAVE